MWKPFKFTPFELFAAPAAEYIVFIMCVSMCR